MRLLVVLNHLELGGAQLNALDFALATREHGHEVVVFGPVYEDRPGPVAEMVRSAGLPLVLAHHPDSVPGVIPARRGLSRALSQTVADQRIQLVHAYEFPLILDSFYGPHLKFGVPLIGTIYGTIMQWWLPRYLPFIVGTREFAERATRLRKQPLTVIEPPINTAADDPAIVDCAPFRHAHGLGQHIVIGIVSRLEPKLKGDGIKCAMAAVRYLDDPRIRLVVTGQGPSADELSALANQVNAALGRRAVVMTGPLNDPRPAYAATDIALGMGGSALRAMAFGKPLIVLGPQGFAKPFLPSTADEFLLSGFSGIGSGDIDPRSLAAIIRQLVDEPETRLALGAFGRQIILDRFSLEAAAAKLERVYATAVVQTYPRHQRLQEALRVAASREGARRIPGSVRTRLGPKSVVTS